MRMLTGQEPFVYDMNILRERYKHYTPHVRTKQIGTYKHRNPKLIDDKQLYKRVVGRMIGNLLTKGPDFKRPNRYPSRPRPSPPSSYSSSRPRPPPPRRPSPSFNLRPPRFGNIFGSKNRPSNTPSKNIFGSKKRPNSGRSRPKYPYKLPIVQDPTGHPYPPQPNGAQFSFEPKTRPKKQVSLSQAYGPSLQGGFLPSAPYWKTYDHLYNPNPTTTV